MKAGKEPMRTFGDLLQFYQQQPATPPLLLRVWQNTKWFLARAMANARLSRGKRRLNQICGGGVEHQDGL
jgi:hypothetical protein